MSSTVGKHTKNTSSLCIILLAFITCISNTSQYTTIIMITKSDNNINCPIMRCLKLGSVLLCAPGCRRKLGYYSSTKEL